jgi:hypothetical protein
MGTHYPLTGAYAVAGHVEGRAHWLVKDVAENDERVSVLVAFHGIGGELGKHTLQVTKTRVLETGGTQQDWIDLTTTAANSSDVDDVVEMLVDAVWGLQLIWGAFHLMRGQSL